MNVKKDLTDIGYLLITPVPKKYRFEGVNYRRATTQLIVGSFALQVAFIAAVTYGPMVVDHIRDLYLWDKFKKNPNKK
jgi:hypothetical protein